MRPVVKSVKHNADGTALEYAHWGDAKQDLVDEIGDYCSYCEKQVPRASLHVEHIRGRKVRNQLGEYIYAHLENRWDNFLLACPNCNGVKGRTDIAQTNPFLPHENNLVHFIEANQGLISIKTGLSSSDNIRTTAFINLVGLDRHPGHRMYSDTDDRWDYRLSATDLARRQFDKYSSTPRTTDLETIVSLARTSGFFSVWYYQFINRPEVLAALVHGMFVGRVLVRPFRGTHVGSFPRPDFLSTARP